VNLVEAFIHSVAVTDIGFLVLLKNTINNKMVPIFIGPMEAQSISMVLMKNSPPRPMTHDLIKTIIENLDYTLKEIHITEIKNNTFYAKLFIIPGSGHDDLIEIDSRPSDAIALALRFHKQIYLCEDVINESGIIIDDNHDNAEKPDAAPETVSSVSRKANDQIGQLQKKLDIAVKEERYEEAAEIRDAMKKLTGESN